MKTTLRKTIVLTVLSLAFLSTSSFAQLSASADVLISLIKGLSIQNQGGSNIDFGEVIVTSSAQTPQVTPSNGAHFLVTGHPGKNVTISFSNVTLSNSAWVSTYNAGSSSTMTFVPSMEETGKEGTYSSGTPSSVSSGNSVALVNDHGIGYLNLWVGGSITVAADQDQGDYVGDFTVTVAY
jgi:hypothetical protein